MNQSHLLEFYNEFIIKQDYFECHEIMEDHWKDKIIRTKKDPEVFLILVATAEYHYRRGNICGAVTTYKRALKLYQEASFNLIDLGLSSDAVIKFSNRLHSIYYVNFKPIEFPLSSEFYQLLHSYSMAEVPYSYFMEYIKKEYIKVPSIIHKHKLRDRRQVIAEREHALQHKKRTYR